MANSTEYGLGSTIVSKDLNNAKLLARQISAGICFINKAVTSHTLLPCGGVKRSGFGRVGGRHGYEEFGNVKTIWVGR